MKDDKIKAKEILEKIGISYKFKFVDACKVRTHNPYNYIYMYKFIHKEYGILKYIDENLNIYQYDEKQNFTLLETV
ncbi:hypothetical protein HN682_09900 [Candidatus Peregrinibacteria bacterium]|jgi:hypothetical protein|nr:hypothetical protein [Candidatus Peregrinibacteria bacterium]